MGGTSRLAILRRRLGIDPAAGRLPKMPDDHRAPATAPGVGVGNERRQDGSCSTVT